MSDVRLSNSRSIISNVLPVEVVLLKRSISASAARKTASPPAKSALVFLNRRSARLRSSCDFLVGQRLPGLRAPSDVRAASRCCSATRLANRDGHQGREEGSRLRWPACGAAWPMPQAPWPALDAVPAHDGSDGHQHCEKSTVHRNLRSPAHQKVRSPTRVTGPKTPAILRHNACRSRKCLSPGGGSGGPRHRGSIELHDDSYSGRLNRDR